MLLKIAFLFRTPLEHDTHIPIAIDIYGVHLEMSLVELTGIEPATSSMPWKRSPR